jgi:short-subunit dehydrogenase
MAYLFYTGSSLKKNEMNTENNNTQKNFALITGGTSGIGYELAKCFAEAGYKLALVARTEEDLERVADEIGNQYSVTVETFAFDLFDIENAFALYADITAKNIRVDVLVNDAGQGHYGKFVDTDIDRDLAIIQLNISSVVALTKLFLKDMLKYGEGKILNVSSVASKMPGPWQSVYHGTKAFVQSFTEALRNEVKDQGIVVTALLPGATDTDFFNKADMQDAKNVRDGDLADPAKVARDGFDALMKGEDKVISGFMNKVQVGMSNIMPEKAVAEKVNKQQEPVSKKENK